MTDICVTDYSSLVFEYSLFRRPMIFFAYDLDDYYDWRGFYYPYEDFVCGPIVTTNLELIRTVQNIDSYDISRVEAFRERFMTACDGHATERILDTVFGKETLAAHRRSVPLHGAFHTVPRAPRRSEEKLAARLRRWFFGSYLPHVYRRGAKRPVTETAVFLQYRGASEREDFAPLRQAFSEVLPGLSCRTVLLSRATWRAARVTCAAAGTPCGDRPCARACDGRGHPGGVGTLPCAARRRTCVCPPPFTRCTNSAARRFSSYIGGYELPFDRAPYENVTLGPAPASRFVPLFSVAYGREAPLRRTGTRPAAFSRLCRVRARPALREFPAGGGTPRDPSMRPPPGGAKSGKRPRRSARISSLCSSTSRRTGCWSRAMSRSAADMEDAHVL